jgi:hypothetical protein
MQFADIDRVGHVFPDILKTFLPADGRSDVYAFPDNMTVKVTKSQKVFESVIAPTALIVNDHRAIGAFLQGSKAIGRDVDILNLVYHKKQSMHKAHFILHLVVLRPPRCLFFTCSD